VTEIELSGIYFLPEEKGICQVLFELRTEGAFPREGQSYRGASPHPLCDALRSTLHEVLERTEALHGTIEAFGLTLSGRPEPTSESSRFITAPPAGRSARVQGMMSWRVGTDSRDSVEIARRQEAIPILYRGQPSGSLSLHLSSSNERLRRQQEREALGRELGLRLARIEIHHWARNKLDLDISLIGESASFTRLEAEIAKVGAVLYPVVIEAEFGSRELEIAAAIHCSSPRRDGPFVVFH